MSKIVSLFPPSEGPGTSVSGSSGKKSLKSSSLSAGNEAFDPAISKKGLRKKKMSFMDHLLSHGEMVSTPPVMEVKSPIVPGKKGIAHAAPTESGQQGQPGEPSSDGSLSVKSSHRNPESNRAEHFPTVSKDIFSPALVLGKKSAESGKIPSGTQGMSSIKTGPAGPLPAPFPAEDVRSVATASPESSKAAEGSKEAPFPTSPTRGELFGGHGGVSGKTPKVDGFPGTDAGQETTALLSAPILKVAPSRGDKDPIRGTKTDALSTTDTSFEKGRGEKNSFSPDPLAGSLSPLENSAYPDSGSPEQGFSRDRSQDLPTPDKSRNAQQSPPGTGALLPEVMTGAPVAVSGNAPAIDTGELLSRVTRSARQGGGEVSLHVHPPALGPIMIHVHVDPKTREVEVRLVARDEAVVELLRGKTEEIKGALGREGFTMHHFHVEVGGDRQVFSSSAGQSLGSSVGGDGGNSGQGSPAGGGPFLSPGSGGGFPAFSQGGDGSRGKTEGETRFDSGGVFPEEALAGSLSREKTPGDVLGFHRVV